MSKRTVPKFQGFVTCELSEMHSKTCKERELTLEALDNTLIALVEGGYKLTLKWDEDNQCYLALLMTESPMHDHAGWILSARGSGPAKTLKQLFYKHFEMLKENWGSGMRNPRVPFDD